MERRLHLGRSNIVQHPPFEPDQLSLVRTRVPYFPCSLLGCGSKDASSPSRPPDLSDLVRSVPTEPDFCRSDHEVSDTRDTSVQNSLTVRILYSYQATYIQRHFVCLPAAHNSYQILTAASGITGNDSHSAPRCNRHGRGRYHSRSRDWRVLHDLSLLPRLRTRPPIGLTLFRSFVRKSCARFHKPPYDVNAKRSNPA